MNPQKSMHNRLAILASGKGTTAEPLFDLASLVIVSSSEAQVLKRVEEFNKTSEKLLKVVVINRSNFESREKFGEALLKVLKENEINFISQNGWTVYTPENVLAEYKGKIINAHPGPLDPGHPDFGGKGMNDLCVHQAILNFAKKVNRKIHTEIDLHLVTEEFDKGDLVAYSEVEIKEDDTPETLQPRVKEAERKLLKEFWTKVLESGNIEIIQRPDRVIKEGEENILVEAKQSAIEKYSQA